MATPTVLARLAAPLLEVCRSSAGARVASALAERFGLQPELWNDPEARLPLSAWYDLLEAAATATGLPRFGAELSLSLDPVELEVLGLLALSSPDLGTILERAVRYQALVSTGERTSLEFVDDRVRLRFEPWGPPRVAHRIWVEAAMVDLIVGGRKVIGVAFPCLRVCFRHPAPPDARALAELFDAPIEFDAPHDLAELPRSALSLPVPGANPALFAYFDARAMALAERFEQQSGASLLEDVRAVIEATLPEGVPSLDAVAARLRASPRTLQRRLTELGTSLRDVIDRVRHDLALRHLQRGFSIAEISFLLGFSEPSAFHRAFRRWTGSTPLKWREAGKSG